MKNKFSDLLPYAGLVSPGIIITKDAQLLRTFKIVASDFSFSSFESINTSLRNLNNTFRMLGEGWSFWIDSHRYKAKPESSYFHHESPEISKLFDLDRGNSLGEFYKTDFFLTLCFSTSETKKKTSLQFRNSKEGAIKYELGDFINITDDIYNVYKSVFHTVLSLDSSELLTYIHSLFSDRHPVKIPETPFYLDVYLSDKIFRPDTITKLGDEYVLASSIHDFPDSTHAGMISTLMQQPYEFRVTSRFMFLSRDKARSTIKSFRKAHFQKRKGLGAIFSEAVTKEASELENTEALALTSDCSEALSLMAASDVNYGHLTTTVITRTKDYNRGKHMMKEIRKIINDMEFIAKEESFNIPSAFLGTLPGILNFNPRKPLISTRNLAHFFPVSDKWLGHFTNSHVNEVCGVKYPHAIVKSGNSPFYLNLNNGDVGHTLIIGPTGSGKSILLNFLALQWLRYPASRIIFFDKDKSSKHPCQNVGGQFFDLGDKNCTLKLNPFGDIKDKSYRIWFSNFLLSYLRKKISISPSDEQEVYTTLETMAEMDVESFSFTTFQSLIQTEEIRLTLSAFVEGEYSDLFHDGGKDLIDNHRWLTFEMNKLMSRGADIVSFVLGYLFTKLEEQFDGTLTLLVLDEGWLFLDDPYFQAQLKNWLKTLRKKNVYVLFATQELQDARNNLLSTLINSCMTKIILPNSQALQSENHELYLEIGLTDDDVSALSEAIPKRDYFYLSTKGKQMFSLCLSEYQLSILKSSVVEEL